MRRQGTDGGTMATEEGATRVDIGMLIAHEPADGGECGQR